MNLIEKLPPVARSIPLECKKCGRETYFRVIAHTSEIKAKCECEICKSKKTFTLKSSTTRPKSSFAKTRVKRKTTDPMQIWLELKEKQDGKQSKPYAMRGTFFLNDVVDHPKFGKGVVTEVNARKLLAVFEDGSRELLHNRKD
jgi:hypothetical protein